MQTKFQRGARTALWLLLTINLVNYIDRYVLSSVEPEIRAHFFAANDPHAHFSTGFLGTAFLVSYMLSAPLLGWLADRMSRWVLISISILVWSCATVACGLATSFAFLLAMRLLVGVGEGGYGPAAPTIISDYYPLAVRGRKLAYFYVAIPVGVALGYAIGGLMVKYWSWQTAFFVVGPPGLVLAAIAYFQRDPRSLIHPSEKRPNATLRDYLAVLKTKSYLWNTAAMTALTFAMGGLAFWVPGYLEYRGLSPSSRIIFGALTVSAGLAATLLGGWTGDYLRRRFSGAYFLVSGIGVMIAFPFAAAITLVPFPAAWVCMFMALFCLFFNTGPANAALVNVTHPSVRAAAFALNTLIIHAFGDAIAPPLIGAVADRSNMNIAFLVVTGMMFVAGVFWLFGMKHLAPDTHAIAVQTGEDAAANLGVV
jgi:MFS family permease